ncbi:MAG TPA: GDP-L-fucose synthase [Azospirillaceae bacterium]|nr:GDP-L-fucose synthase [Azospirillaceae bacterium]
MRAEDRVYVAGHGGLVGSALVRRLRADGFTNLTLRTHAELDLTKASAVERLFATERIDYVFLAAAKVGGIIANDRYGGDFIRENLLIQTHVIDTAYRSGVKKLLFLGSSCLYPKHAPQPMKEDYLLTGPLEPTNEPYAVAKIAGITMGKAYRRQHGFNVISLMPSNLYGPGDNFDVETSHVLAALMRRIHDAKETGAPEVVIWGTGTPRREFLHVDDLAAACVHLMRFFDAPEIINVGTGEDIAILDLARLVAGVVGYDGAFVTDPSRPDGHPRKVMDVSRLAATGWQAAIGLEDGIRRTYQWFLDHEATATERRKVS